MDGFTTIQRKQTESFRLKGNLGGDFVNRNSFPRWDANGNFNIMGALKLQTGTQEQAVTSTTVGATTGTYDGAVTVGKYIYFIPRGASVVAKIDTETDVITTFGSLGATADKWLGGTLAPNGIIYCVPYQSTDILMIDTKDDSISFIRNVNTAATGYGFSALHNNGLIYALPIAATRMLIIDPASNSIRFGPLITGSAYCKLIPYGDFLYAFPFLATNCLKYNTKSDTYITFGTVTEDAGGVYNSGTLAPNGKMYAAPYGNTGSIGIIDPDTDTFITGAVIGGFINKYVGTKLGANGLIYCIPFSNSSIAIINPVNDTVFTFDSYVGTFKWSRGALARNGSIYCAPYTYTGGAVLKILTPLTRQLSDNFIMNRNL